MNKFPLYFPDKNDQFLLQESLGAFCLSSRPEVFCEKCALKNFAKLIGKHLWWSLFFDEVVVFGSAALLKKTFDLGFFLWILENF